MQMRLPEVYCDVRQAIEDNIGEIKNLILGKYGSLIEKPCRVEHYHIKEKKDDYEVGTVELMLTYKERIKNKYDKFEEIKKTQNLKILSTKGDPLWPLNTVVKVWNGVYPSGIAVNDKTGQIYLINLKLSGFSLVEFGTFTPEQLVAFKEDLNEIEPYRIKLDEDAMFEYISGAEGDNQLKRTLYIEFDCGVKIRVKSEVEHIGV